MQGKVIRDETGELQCVIMNSGVSVDNLQLLVKRILSVAVCVCVCVLLFGCFVVFGVCCFCCMLCVAVRCLLSVVCVSVCIALLFCCCSVLNSCVLSLYVIIFLFP